VTVESEETVRRVQVIACGVLSADLRRVAAALGVDASMEFLPGGLHSRPNELRRRLQAAIDRASAAAPPDVIAVGYGVCGLGTAGLHARGVPLALPRVNDCIALFLGSDAAYREQFARYPGTYYVTAGWVEEKARPQDDSERLAGGTSSAGLDFETLVEKHGRENAEAIRYFLNSWQRNYQRAAFIDTGSAHARRYAEIAQSMAAEFGWKYEELPGSDELLAKLLTARQSTKDILLVPPHHVTVYDPVAKGLKAVPVWESAAPEADGRHTLVFHAEDEPGSARRPPTVRLGLGIDAGGTYTDVVLYDLERPAVVRKAKALTTPWDFTVGIDNALDRLGADRLHEVDLVALSTTLATNAIVEGRGQTAALLILPPYGLFKPADIPHRPIAVLDGRLEIDGSEIRPVDPDQVRRVVRDMVDRAGAEAFAVAGYASHANPAHEMLVREIARAETGLSVTCGHEVSETLNYRVRAATAALNARIIPCLRALIEDVRAALERRGLDAPKMMVKSDGSLMSVAAALRRPIETILSGPAASVAGASTLARLPDALVVDMGGTTTDTAVIRDGVVRTCPEGASVGGWRTHVQALDLRTLGLGGDSLIARERHELRIGPRRVAPVAWLAAREGWRPDTIDWLERHLDDFAESTSGMEMLAWSGRRSDQPLSDDEARILDALAGRPLSAHELARRLGSTGWPLLLLKRLEARYLVQRCGLTPTDLLHATGRIRLWDGGAARRFAELFSRLMGLPLEAFADRVLGRVVRRLATELLKKELGEAVDADDVDASPAARELISNAFDGGTDGYRVRLQLRRPVIGIGAPVHCFLPGAARLLETEAVIPADADVANAIGAVASSVLVHQRARLVPNESGGYSVSGLAGAPVFADFAEAHRFAVEQLVAAVRDRARRAGTSESRVQVVIEDRTAPVADGGSLFLGRRFDARLSGRPDIARLTRAADDAGRGEGFSLDY